jgi:hypothetical protein
MENEKKNLKYRLTEKVVCHWCNKEFDKPCTDAAVSRKLNRKMFCSKICCGRYTATIHKNKGNLKSLSKAHSVYMEKYKRDPFLSPFNYLLGKARNRFHDFSLCYADLLEQWNKQEGKCAYSKIPLKLCTNKIKHGRIYSASLDRIDSNIGYVKGNVQFVSISINYMKGAMTHEETIELINLIKQSEG